MTILITGASGLIGSHVCRTLAENGADVVGLVHSHLISVRPGLRVDVCDITDYDDVSRTIALYRPDTIFHLAAHLPCTDNPDFIKVNVTGTSNLLDACYRGRVKNFVFASSMSVYSTPPVHIPVGEGHPTRPDDVYGKTKLIGELLCKCYSRVMRTVSIRFSGVFGSGNYRVVYRFMQAALAGKAIQVDGDGDQSSDFIHVDNAVQGALLALEKGKSGEVYNIGSGKETSVLELANMIAGLVNHPVEVKLSGETTPRPFRFVADISKAIRELGYRPSDLVEGLRKYREEMR